VRGAQLFAGIGAAVLASQPFSVDQVGAAERPRTRVRPSRSIAWR
jgi:hypothetical protein